jgi:hypothetical protein
MTLRYLVLQLIQIFHFALHFIMIFTVIESILVNYQLIILEVPQVNFELITIVN